MPPASASAMGAKGHSFADIVKASMCSAIEEKKSKNEIVIQGLPENDHDEQDVCEMCTRASVNMKLVTVNPTLTDLANFEHLFPRHLMPGYS